jgi:hypothetical protein
MNDAQPALPTSCSRRAEGLFAVVFFEEIEGAEEDGAGDEDEQDDGVAVGRLGLRWSGGGVVAALRAALGKQAFSA